MRQPRPASLAAALSLALAAAPAAAVENGFYAGVAADWSIVDVDFGKTIGLDAAAAGAARAPDEYRDAGGAFSRRSAADDDGDIVGLKALAGYRWRLSERFYFAGELEAVKYDSEEVSGRVTPTASTGDGGSFDIWRGVWKFEKDHSFGINTKLGYAPGGGLLGDGSVYALFGVRWLDGDLSASFASGDIADIDRGSYSETPWRVGVGMEIGDADSWFDLQLSYADYDVDFSAGTPSEVTNPRRILEYEVEEWGLSLGYTRRFGD